MKQEKPMGADRGVRLRGVPPAFKIGFPVVMAVVLAAFGLFVLPAYALSGTISGQVTSPGGYPLPAGTVVKLFTPGSENVVGQASPALNDGSYSFGPVPNGLYVLKAVPPAGSGLTQSLPRPVSVVSGPVSGVTLNLTTPQISGVVTAPDGVTPADAVVNVLAGDGTLFQQVPAPGGQFLAGGLPPGGYWLRGLPTTDDPYWKSDLMSVDVPDLNANQTVTITLEDAHLWGYVHDEFGAAIPNAAVVAARGDGDHQSDHTSASGYWAIGDLVSGPYTLVAFPPVENIGLLHSEPQEVTLPGATNPYTLVLNTPPKVVSGEVRTNTGIPVTNAQVIARRVHKAGFAEVLTGAGGSYEIQLSSGLWALSVHPISGSVPADWVFPLPPQLVYFQFNNDPQTHQQDFTVLTADAAVNGVVEMPGGGVPPFTTTVALHNSEGIGRATQIDPGDGSFTIAIPNGGYKVAVHPEDPAYLGPVVEPIQVPPDGAYDLGTLTLVAKDAMITGTVTNEAGIGVEGVPMVAWRPGAPGSQQTHSGPDGMYALAVSGETWHIQPAPGPELPYLYTGDGARVDVPPAGVVADVDFSLIAADATIAGVLVDGEGNPITDVDGWASAHKVGDPAFHNGAPIVNGAFTIFIPDGTYHVAAHLPAGSPYVSTGERQVSIASGETITLTLPLTEKDASIAGALWDPRNNDVVAGVAGIVGAWQASNWAATHINTGNGTYKLDVASGIWHLNYRIDPSAGYAKISGPKNIPLQSGQTAVVPLPIIPKDAAISGTVLDPDGSPLPGAVVIAKGLSGAVSHLWLHTHADQDGNFTLAVPFGRYRLGAAGGQPGWIKPVEKIVEAPPGGVSDGHTLQFQLPDATIEGTLTVQNAQGDGTVYVWAWSDDGGFTHGRFPVTYDPGSGEASGPYNLDVISGTVWHLGAVLETPSQYWFGRAAVHVTGSKIVQDLDLLGPHPKPGPVVVTFEAANPQRIALADGTHIFIPGGAMPVEGLVTLRIVPIATLPHQHHARLIKYGYAFLATDEAGMPIEAHFNQEVVIHFAYDEDELVQSGIPEPWLKPAYFSTTTNEWTFPVSYVVDTDADQVVMQIDHFTDFALTANASTALYMPVIRR